MASSPEALAKIRLEVSNFDPTILELTGDYTRSQIVRLLLDIRFSKLDGFVRTVVLDRDVRDALVSALGGRAR